MEALDYWTPADALAFRCSVDQVGTLKPVDTALCSADLREDVQLARAYAHRAVRALVRVMEECDGRAAVEAAREVLLRAYGPVLVQSTEPSPVQAEPVWLTAQRLAYQVQDRLPSQLSAGQCLPRQQPTSQSLTSQSSTDE